MDTAMQRLKWFISDGLDNLDESTRLSDIWEKLDQLIEQEKEQIIDAVNKGTFKKGTQYYKETYKK